MARQKTCPDCAESILRAAKVCKHCGYRFDLNPDATKKDGGIRWWVVGIIGVVALFLILGGKEKTNQIEEVSAAANRNNSSAAAQTTVQQPDYQATISDGAYTPITKAGAAKLYAQWGKDGIDRINAAMERAVGLTAKSTKCDKVFSSGYSFDQSTPKKSIVVFSDCTNGERFIYTEEETKTLTGAKPSLSEDFATISDINAITSCENVVKTQIKHPSTLDGSWFNSTVDRKEMGINIAYRFEAKNDFGAMMPYVAYCNISNPDRVDLLSIKPR